jgi:hypothetical protein
MLQNPTSRSRAVLSLLLLALAGCGAPEEDDGSAGSRQASSTSFAGVVGLCPSTSSWGAWSQTSLSTWDSDVKPVVQWIINTTKVSSSTYSGHDPSIGRAADWRPHSRDEGTKMANWFLANTKSSGTPLGIKYIIWQAQIFQPSSGVKTMADRGSFTQNHCDHIHISFVASGSVQFDSSQVTPWNDPAPKPDAKPQPTTPDGGSTDTKAPVSADAGVLVQTPSSDAASVPLAASPAPEAPASPLVGGCSFVPARGSNLWMFGLAVLAFLALQSARRQRS